jgi:hypothetical protein
MSFDIRLQTVFSFQFFMLRFSMHFPSVPRNYKFVLSTLILNIAEIYFIVVQMWLYSEDQLEKNEIGEACSMYARQERSKQDLGGET